MEFQGERKAELALALGVQEVRPVDLVTAYGTLANGGKEIPHTSILAIKDAERRERPAALRPAGRHAGRQPAGRLHRHGHPGRQHQQEHQPVLGQVRDHGSRRAPAGDAQDRHQQRRQGPQRLRLHRAADRQGPLDRRVRPRRRRLERQLGQQPGLDGPVPAVLDRRLHLRLAGLPQRGHREVAGDELQAAGGRSGPGQDRPVDRPPGQLGQPRGRRVVHRRRPSPRTGWGRTSAASMSSCTSTSRPGSTGGSKADRDWLRRADRGPGVVGGPDRTRTAYFYQGGFHPYGASWGALVGGRLQACPDTELFRRAHAGRRRGRAIVRAADPGRLGAGGTPLPARQPERVAERAPVDRAIRPAQRGATTDARADAGADARADTRADPVPTPAPTPVPTPTPVAPPPS